MTQMNNAARFSFITVMDPSGQPKNRPLLPVRLASLTRSLSAQALMDSGADVNVLPLQLGLQLGLRWDVQPRGGSMRGAFAATQTRLIQVGVQIRDFAVIPLVFIWVESDSVPLILGQFDFFEEYDVCFFRSQGYFELKPRTTN